ncbi:MAG: tRNA-binding protein [Candidatus Peribacteraceae bacterium]|nr:tRNA-binding protein [Candidatus Peribacteraceae bacterium]
MSKIISYPDFEKVDMRVGRIIDVQDFPEARKPAYKLTIDFGPEIGTKKSSAQITQLYTKETLMNRLVVCTINFAPKQIGPFMSECLTMGAANADGHIALLGFDTELPLGSRIF